MTATQSVSRHQFKGQMIDLGHPTMRAGQIKNAAEPERIVAGGADAQWAEKTRESKVPGDVNSDDRWHGAGVYDAIKKEGIKNPVHLYEKGPGFKEFSDSPPVQNYMMGDGHHRVAAGAAIEEETGNAFHIPVHTYYDFDRLPGRARGTDRTLGQLKQQRRG